MKANRKFVEADEAVSPVIAVILMVAITVVLAATVFVLVSDIGGNTSKTQPSVGWADSEVDDTWTVNQAPQQVNWSAYQIKAAGGAGGLTVELNSANAHTVTGSYTTLPGATWGNMKGGDVLCFDNGAAAQDVKITLLHIESNSVAHEYTFQTMADITC